VRNALFRPARGRRGYREAPVDAFFDRVVELMVAFDH
jgi:DivIVA domain-containing protein